MDDDELDIVLRAPSVVAERCIILAALLNRLWIESFAKTANDRDLAAEAFDIRAWLQTEGLWDRLDGVEQSFLVRPVGRLNEDEIATVSSRTEGLATLGWAMGFSELLPPGEMSEFETVIKMVPSPWDRTEQWIRRARLRPETEIARERDRAEIIAWRIGVEALLRDATGQERAEFDQAIADVAREAATAGLAKANSSGDITICGLEPGSLDRHELERLAILAQERLRALNWLCGFGESWSHVPLDV